MTLQHLFLGDFPLPAPGAHDCGEDPTDDDLDCSGFESCETDEEVIARVTAVTTSGSPGAYSFSVTIESPDTGCDQYADWWEVVCPGGVLIYRRILAHSHVSEQPFRRSGGPVAIEPGDEVIVRAHMNTTGYSREVMRGSIEAGFAPTRTDGGFASELEEREPLPGRCAF